MQYEIYVARCIGNMNRDKSSCLVAQTHRIGLFTPNTLETESLSSRCLAFMIQKFLIFSETKSGGMVEKNLSLVSVPNILSFNPKFLCSEYDVKAYVLLIAIRPSDLDVKPHGPLDAFRCKQSSIGTGVLLRLMRHLYVERHCTIMRHLHV